MDINYNQLAEALRPVIHEVVLESLEGVKYGPAEDLMTIEGVAELTGLTRSTIYSKTHGEATDPIPHMKRSKRLYFSRSEIKEWILNN